MMKTDWSKVEPGTPVKVTDPVNGLLDADGTFEKIYAVNGSSIHCKVDSVISPYQKSGVALAADTPKQAQPTQEIFKQIENERMNQDAQWGGAKHDDANGADNWFGIIRKQLSRFMRDGDSLSLKRHALICVAAVCIAAIQSIDRWEAGKG